MFTFRQRHAPQRALTFPMGLPYVEVQSTTHLEFSWESKMEIELQGHQTNLITAISLFNV